MAPLKIKLSLSSAGVQGSSSDQPATSATPAQDGSAATTKRGKANVTPAGAINPGLLTNEREQPEAGPSRLPAVATPSEVNATPSTYSGAATPYDTPSRPPKAAKTASNRGKAKSKARGKGKRPSAIPTRLLSSTPSTPKPAAPLPLIDTPSPSGEATVKIEEGEEAVDQSGYPSTPGPGPYEESAQTPGTGENGTPFTGETGTPNTGQKQSQRWMRIKRPMRELATKILADLVKRDDYDLFGEPVDLEAYPDYLGIVGGEEKMMDLGTMQNKVDNEEYPSFVEFQADLEKLVNAAKTFNPPGTVPHNAAIKLFNQGLKQIDRSRDLVLTPGPSRAGSTSRWRDGSMVSGREMTANTDDGRDHAPLKSELPPLSYIPEEMLDYPANSTAAKLVGWNLNGGRRVYAKRITRGRERFTGKWRHWDLDGSRDVAEMDETDMLFELAKERRGTALRSTVDWMEMRREPWWEYEGLGGPNGQPPLPGASLPKRVEFKEREIRPVDVGVYPDIALEMRARRQRHHPDERSVLLAHLDNPPRRPTAPNPTNFTNLFERPGGRMPIDYLRELQSGDAIGEAYTRSVDRFIQGAIDGRVKSSDDAAGDVKMEQDTSEEPADLHEYVREHCGAGALDAGREARPTVRSTLRSLQHLRSQLETGQPVPADLERVYASAKAAYGRAALHVLTDTSNSLDITPLIRQPPDFNWQGIGGKGDIPIGLKWVSTRMAEYNEQIEAKLSSRKRSASPGSGVSDSKRVKMENGDADVKTESGHPTPAVTATPMSLTTFDSPLDRNDGEDGLKRIRLELLACTKFYPLAALRKMDKATAEKLLPPNVRALMTKPNGA